VKKLAWILPLGALAALLFAVLVARWSDPLPRVKPVAAAAGASLPPIDFPVRGKRLQSRVEDAQGRPIARATVWLLSGAELAFVESGADGTFTFDHVQKGDRQLFVVAENFAPARATITGSEALEKIVLGNPLPPPPSLTAMKRSTLRGVVRAEGFDANGCQVCLAPRAPIETLGAPIPVRVECGPDGAFVFEELIEGAYTVQVFPRWAVNGSWPDLLRPLAGADLRTLDHAEGAHVDGLELAPVCARVSGTLRDTLGGALEGAFVLVAPAADPARVWPPATSDARGAFVVRDLPPGKYVVGVRAGGDAAQLEIELGPSEVRELNVRPLDVAKTR